jgi:hypothetical protein
VLKSTIEKMSLQKVSIVKILEENVRVLENDLEFRNVKIDTLEKELKIFEEKFKNFPEFSPPIDIISESLPSTSKCGKCEYESDDEIELETHMKSNHLDRKSQNGNNQILFKYDICAFNASKA